MIAFLEGVVAERGAGRVVLAVGGTGYELAVPAQTLARLPPLGRRARLFTRLQLRDEAPVLYGFATAEERTLFDQLITVNGVGPKAALALLSVLSPDALRRAIGEGDVEALTLAPGVGRKVANRVILDLREKLGGSEAPPPGPLSEVREALLALGLSPQEAREALSGVEADGERSVEELLRQALRRVGAR
ncbi:MAG TPA: Holliday junction branch migration protein RuvA [Actinomycetota bacterium]|nr:Holliday junction branch migration protein RuvA [Actinomycetota bacterium]